MGLLRRFLWEAGVVAVLAFSIQAPWSLVEEEEVGVLLQQYQLI
jgi:hypothetical protein